MRYIAVRAGYKYGIYDNENPEKWAGFDGSGTPNRIIRLARRLNAGIDPVSRWRWFPMPEGPVDFTLTPVPIDSSEPYQAVLIGDHHGILCQGGLFYRTFCFY